MAKAGIEPKSAALEADALPLGQRGGTPEGAPSPSLGSAEFKDTRRSARLKSCSSSRASSVPLGEQAMYALAHASTTPALACLGQRGRRGVGGGVVGEEDVQAQTSLFCV